MGAFVILAQVTSHWPHFKLSDPGLVFSDDAGGLLTAGDDNGIAAASK